MRQFLLWCRLCRTRPQGFGCIQFLGIPRSRSNKHMLPSGLIASQHASSWKLTIHCQDNHYDIFPWLFALRLIERAFEFISMAEGRRGNCGGKRWREDCTPTTIGCPHADNWQTICSVRQHHFLMRGRGGGERWREGMNV